MYLCVCCWRSRHQAIKSIRNEINIETIIKANIHNVNSSISPRFGRRTNQREKKKSERKNTQIEITRVLIISHIQSSSSLLVMAAKCLRNLINRRQFIVVSLNLIRSMAPINSRIWSHGVAITMPGRNSNESINKSIITYLNRTHTQTRTRIDCGRWQSS